jgi:hypothetical protein
VIDPDLADAVLAESARHKQRSPGRRAAGQVWVALMTTSSTEAARRAIPTFGTKDVQVAALELFDRLTAGSAPITTEPEEQTA